MDPFVRIISEKEKPGILGVIEFDGLPFVPKRIFWVKDVPAGEERGGHAHYVTEQYLVCIQGEIEVSMFNGSAEMKVTLSKGQAALVPAMVWDTQRFLTGEDVMLVLCSTSYNPRDYITDMQTYVDIQFGG